MAFKKRSAPEATADTPEKLFALLPRTGKNSPSLWSQQSDLLREYTKHPNTRDLSIELPTGTGKTLTGLLIAEWRRRTKNERAVFACPTRQLVKQVATAAAAEGIYVVDLSGSHKFWNPSEKMDYERGRAIAVVTYKTIFNTYPQLASPDIIIFDDAHAGEQYVSDTYTVKVSRTRYFDIYEKLLEILEPAIGAERHRQLLSESPGRGTQELVDAIFLALSDEWLEDIQETLNEFAKYAENNDAKSQRYALELLSEHLAVCTLYLTWNQIEIRPPTPPTFDNELFRDANQRVYLSATLGSAGELERAFGRPRIKRIALPEQAPTPKSGRKFLLFPTLVPDSHPDDLIEEILEMVGKAVVITPSEKAADIAERDLVPTEWTVLNKFDVKDSLAPFSNHATDVALVLANRYDGLDLPGDTCRTVVLYGYPGATNLQERFYTSRAHATAVLDERVRTRIIQGMGRCTRGPGDHALVIVADEQTRSYLSRREVTTSLSPDLQAEIEFGLEQSDTSSEEILDNVQSFLNQDTSWHNDAEPEISKAQEELHQTIPSSADPLVKAARHEVSCLEYMWHSDWHRAGDSLHTAAEELSSAPEARGYRAMLLFRSAVLLHKAAREKRDSPLAGSAKALAQQAMQAAAPSQWMAPYMGFLGNDALSSTAPLHSATRQIAARIRELSHPTKMAQNFDSILTGLEAITHKEFEPALILLGDYIGAESSKPTGDGRTDSAWCWGEALWLTLEAKSEHEPDNAIGIDDVRQVSGHLQLVAKDRNSPIPDFSASVLVSPRTRIKRDAAAIAPQHTFRVTPSTLTDLTEEVKKAWSRISTFRGMHDENELLTAVKSALREHRITPEEILERLTSIPLSES
jgi:hypothetical protein